MQRRSNFAHLSVTIVVTLGLMPMMADAAPQAQIAFVSDRDGNMEIYVMNDDGRKPLRLTNNRHDDYSPAWSPDGKRIVFGSKRDGNGEIYVMNNNGGKT